MKPKLILYLTLVLIAGCSAERFSQGHGDAGQFMLQHVVAYGGATRATNNLPVMEGPWHYRQDKSGVVVRLPASNYDSVRKFVNSTFGVGSLTGQSCPPIIDLGVLITVQKSGNDVLVSIYQPMSYSKQEQIIANEK